MSSHWNNSSNDDPSSSTFGAGLTADEARRIGEQQRDLGRRTDVPLPSSCPPAVADAYRDGASGK